MIIPCIAGAAVLWALLVWAFGAAASRLDHPSDNQGEVRR